MISCALDIHQRRRRLDAWVGHDNHDKSVRGELVDECRKVGVANLHALQLRLRLDAAQLELLDDVGDFFEAVNVVLLLGGGVRNH